MTLIDSNSNLLSDWNGLLTGAGKAFAGLTTDSVNGWCNLRDEDCWKHKKITYVITHLNNMFNYMTINKFTSVL